MLKLKSLREQKNYSQDYLAHKLDISQSNYAKIENEQIGLTINRLRQISELFQVSVNEIIDLGSNLNSSNDLNMATHTNIMDSSKINTRYMDLLLKEKDLRIKNLEDEIAFLRNNLKK